ncbi:hypothetical protein BC831DRAFT_452194 [Entophlyctis helioformis]|nr:hypothetical protein BC831DRAFT_452194 [Entophlyctis helioformis]
MASSRLAFAEIEADSLRTLQALAALPLARAQVPQPIDPQLHAFLHSSPFVYNLQLPLSPAVRRNIVSVLSYSLCTGSRDVFRSLFGSAVTVVEPLAFGAGDHNDNDGDDDGQYVDDDEPGLPLEYQKTQRGKPAAMNCALDETCVFCVRCFRATNHDGHDTSFSIAAESGGCCDCGDPEAWKVPVQCKYHAPVSTAPGGPSTAGPAALDGAAARPKPEPQPLPPHIVAGVRSTIATVLEFVVAVFARSPEMIAMVESMDAIQEANPPDRSFPADDRRQAVYSVILWNDESHSFQEVIEQVMDALHCSENDGRFVAETVDQRGRIVLRSSDSLPTLIGIGRNVASIHLTASIRSARETFREEIAAVAIDWLKTLSRHVVGVTVVDGVEYEPVEKVVRTVICQELAATLATSLGEHDVVFPQLQDLLSPPATQATTARSRVDYLLAFDSRLWKEVRISLRELYISSMIVSGDLYKRSMALHFAESYLQITRGYLFHDREYELSIINFAVQLFTVPTIASHLVAHTDLMPCIFALLKAYYLSDVLPDQYDLRTNFYNAIQHAMRNRLPIYPVLHCDGEATRQRRNWHMFHDVRYLLMAHRVRDGTAGAIAVGGQRPIGASATVARSAGELHLRTSTLGQQLQQQQNESLRDAVPVLPYFLDLCLVWQGMNPQRRSVFTHVEYETENWLSAFNSSLQISRLVRYFGESFFGGGSESAGAMLVFAISETRDVLLKWTLYNHVETTREMRATQTSVAGVIHRPPVAADGFHAVELVPGIRCRVPDFRVALQPVSMHMSLHWLLACLAEQVPRLLRRTSKDEPRRTIVHQIFDTALESPALDRLDVVDDTDRTTVFDVVSMGQRLSLEDRLALIFEFPLRSVVFISQIKADVWVRNGSIMRSQALHYKDSTLRDCYDHDLLLLQFASICLGPDKLLTMLIDRFELVPWFQGNTASPELSHFGAAQVSSFVQDLLQVVIILLTERSAAGAVSVTDELRREIIHHLAVHRNGVAYSELTKRISEHLIDATNEAGTTASAAAAAASASDPSAASETQAATPQSFDEILSSVAHFKFPEGPADHGTYELRDQFYSEVDPWFWHYTRNEREDVEDVLRKRAETRRNRKRPHGGSDAHRSEDEGLHLPVLPLLQPGAGFDRVVGLIHSRLFNQMVFYALWNVTRTKAESGLEPVHSDMVLGEAVHLLVVGFEIVDKATLSASGLGDSGIDQTFIRNAVSVRMPIMANLGADRRPTTLLELILSLVDRANEDDIKDQAPRLRYLVRRFEEIGGEEAKAVIAGWRDKSKWDLGQWTDAKRRTMAAAGSSAAASGGATQSGAAGAAGATAELTDQEKRKQAAKARQAAIMAQFAQAQQSFMANYGDDMDELDEEDDDGRANEASAADTGENLADRPDQREWSYPVGTCIVCQEDTDKSDKLYGMLCFIQQSSMRRQINFGDASTVAASISGTPVSFDKEVDRSMRSVQSEPHHHGMPKRAANLTPSASTSSLHSLATGSASATGGGGGGGQTTAKMPHHGLHGSQPTPIKQSSFEGISMTSCGHLMHITCFQTYMTSIMTRHQSQLTRNQPENIELHEFLCPLCKSLGNSFLPVIWTNRLEKVNWRGSAVPWRDAADAEAETDAGILKSIKSWIVSSGLQLGVAAAGGDHSDRVGDNADAAMRDAYALGAGQRRGSAAATRTTAAGQQPPAGQQALGSSASKLNDYVSGFVEQVFTAHPLLAPAHISYPGNMPENPVLSISRLRKLYSDHFYELFMSLDGRLRTSGRSAAFEVGADVSLLRLARLWDMLGYTICSLEIAGRGAPSSWTPGAPLSALAPKLADVGVLNTISTQMLACLRLLSETTFGALLISWEGSRESIAVYNRSYLSSVFGNDLSGGRMPSQPPALLRDGFSHLVALSMSVIPARENQRDKDEDEVIQWIRVLWIFEMVRCVVSVVESVLLYGDSWLTDPRVVAALATGELSAQPGGQQQDNSKGKQPAYIVVEPGQQPPQQHAGHDGQYDGLQKLIQVVVNEMRLMPDARRLVDQCVQPHVIRALFERVGLVYARRCAILLYARFNMVPPGGATGFGFDLDPRGRDDMMVYNDDEEEIRASRTELERLGAYLGLPSVASLMATPIVQDADFGELISHWMRHFGTTMANHYGVVWSTELAQRRQSMSGGTTALSTTPLAAIAETRTLSLQPGGSGEYGQPAGFGGGSALGVANVPGPTLTARSATASLPGAAFPAALNVPTRRFTPLVALDLPIVFELVSLPVRLESLFEQSRVQPCKKCGTVPVEPALCLFCGTFVCSQSYCCAEKEHGECNLHMAECAGSVGAYLLVKDGIMLLLHNENGFYVNPPYLDAHGEVDLKFRRGRPLFLNQKRYDEIRKQWLTQMIPSYVARKIEQTFDVGGWITL